ncbi:MAG: hypothetical protein DYG98_06245 [Haliscomenobacteraceae bacterium CHB4]|nr:hypothetical protein [Saprospiraceae bacterium]MCE7922636.1 hypothetical protein [Haliscomenobacteraceae bacterium CHB4]
MNRPDTIENFIRDHRAAFDTESPDARGWNSLEKALERLSHADGLETALLLNRPLLDTETPADRIWAGIEADLKERKNEMADPLERFIRENRESLDSEVPDLKVWANITKKTPGKAKTVGIGWQRTLLRAAASVALLVTGLGLGIWYARSTEPPAMAMSEVSNEYAELEHYFKSDIADKQQKLASFTGSQPAEVYADLEQLDNMMAELRLELANVPEGNREQIVRAMIENYKAKAAILERVLERLDESTKTETINSDSSNEIKSI